MKIMRNFLKKMYLKIVWMKTSTLMKLYIYSALLLVLGTIIFQSYYFTDYIPSYSSNPQIEGVIKNFEIGKRRYGWHIEIELEDGRFFKIDPSLCEKFFPSHIRNEIQIGDNITLKALHYKDTSKTPKILEFSSDGRTYLPYEYGRQYYLGQNIKYAMSGYLFVFSAIFCVFVGEILTIQTVKIHRMSTRALRQDKFSQDIVRKIIRLTPGSVIFVICIIKSLIFTILTQNTDRFKCFVRV